MVRLLLAAKAQVDAAKHVSQYAGGEGLGDDVNQVAASCLPACLPAWVMVPACLPAWVMAWCWVAGGLFGDQEGFTPHLLFGDQAGFTPHLLFGDQAGFTFTGKRTEVRRHVLLCMTCVPVGAALV